MKKLELKDICGYLPYELKVFDFESEVMYPFLGYEIDTTLTKILLYDEETDWWNLSNFKPILRPATDLYKPIIHKRKEIVPIVELAKIATLCHGAEWRYKVDKKMAHFFDEIIPLSVQFLYDETSKRFYYRENGEYRIPYNQYQLFDYLHELKIDYRGLIDAGLAISVHDLEFNPYN